MAWCLYPIHVSESEVIRDEQAHGHLDNCTDTISLSFLIK